MGGGSLCISRRKGKKLPSRAVSKSRARFLVEIPGSLETLARAFSMMSGVRADLGFVFIAST